MPAPGTLNKNDAQFGRINLQHIALPSTHCCVVTTQRKPKLLPVGEWAESNGLSKSWALKMGREGHLTLCQLRSPGAKVTRIMVDVAKADAELARMLEPWTPNVSPDSDDAAA
jgi:hypothetical protein